MVQVIDKEPKEIDLFYETMTILLCENEVSIQDLSASNYGTADEGDNEDDLEESGNSADFEDDAIVPESELEKVRLLLKGREEVQLTMSKTKATRKFCKSHRVLRKKVLKEQQDLKKRAIEDPDSKHYIPPGLAGKNEYLYYVGAENCVKEEVKLWYGFHIMQKAQKKLDYSNPKKERKKANKKDTNDEWGTFKFRKKFYD